MTARAIGVAITIAISSVMAQSLLATATGFPLAHAAGRASYCFG